MGCEMILKNIGSVVMIGDGIESAEGLRGFDFAGLLDDDLFFGLLLAVGEFLQQIFNVHNCYFDLNFY